jgi:hypothetical protein
MDCLWELYELYDCACGSCNPECCDEVVARIPELEDEMAGCGSVPGPTECPWPHK